MQMRWGRIARRPPPVTARDVACPASNGGESLMPEAIVARSLSASLPKQRTGALSWQEILAFLAWHTPSHCRSLSAAHTAAAPAVERRYAVVGAGFAGLATAWHLLVRVCVVVLRAARFDAAAAERAALIAPPTPHPHQHNRTRSARHTLCTSMSLTLPASAPAALAPLQGCCTRLRPRARCVLFARPPTCVLRALVFVLDHAKQLVWRALRT